MFSFKLLLLLLASLALKTTLAADAITCRTGVLYPAEAPNGYYQCVNGVLRYETCPGDNTYFDAQMSACRHSNPASQSPDDDVFVTGKCQRIGLTGDLTDCKGYYHCDAKGADLKRSSCLDGQFFHLVQLSCVWGTC